MTEIFLTKYTVEAGLSRDEANKHKKRLFDFYRDFSNHINDYQVWRLLTRVKNELGEPFAEVKLCKMNEIRSLQKINWHVELDQCKLVERAVVELVELFEAKGEEAGQMSKEEKAFIKTTTISIETCLQRKCKIEDLVQRMANE